MYKLLAHLFKNDVAWRYTPRPQHLIFYPTLLMALGVVTFVRDGWVLFGICSFAFGFALGITIILGMNWDKSIEYWDTINTVTNTMMSIKDPNVRHEIWKSMGYDFAPTNAQITVTERREDQQGTFIGLSNHALPVSPAIMQMIADKVFMSGKTDFTEEEYGKFVPRIRKVKKDFKEKRGFITPKNSKNVRLGYSWTKKGIDTLYQFTSEGVKLELERRKRNGE